jgi:4-diphosphocytidyl-2-C-methyl-D-erythritol kinase
MQLGLQLGADVPIFVHGHAAWAEGVGEILTDFSPEMPWYLLVHPHVHVPTSEIFSNSELTRDTTAIKMLTFQNGDGRNDCELVVRKSYPEIQAVFDWFGQASNARLTGTGACVFCPYTTKDEAQEKLKSLPSKWAGYVTRGLNHSPLQDRLDKEQ